MDLGDERRRTGEDWAVPAGVLTHALRTPLNVLKGYASLLASGELGRLGPEAAAAAGEMRRAVGELEASVGLLAPLVPPSLAAQPRLDLGPRFDTAFARAGYCADEAGDFVVDAVAWRGWGELLDAIAQMCAADGALSIDVAGEQGRLRLLATFPRVGAGDGRLAACAALARAAAGGVRLDLPEAGGAQLRAPGLICARGRTTYFAGRRSDEI